MPEIYNDGALPHGSFVAVFSDAVSRKLENFNPQRPSKKINQSGVLGDPGRWAGVNDFNTATATVQEPTQTGGIPDNPVALGMYFERDTGHGVERWVITDIGQRFQMGDYWKSECTFQMTYN